MDFVHNQTSSKKVFMSKVSVKLRSYAPLVVLIMGWISSGYLVTRCVTSRMHSGIPSRLHNALRLHFCYNTMGTKIQQRQTDRQTGGHTDRDRQKGKKDTVKPLMEVFHGTAAECHLPYGITQCYLPPDTSEHTPP